MESWLSPALVWFIIGFIFIVLEFVFPSLIKVFFGLGAWVVALLTLFMPMSVNVQLFVFLLSSLVLLVLLRRWFKQFFSWQSESSEQNFASLEEYLGKRAVVTQPISPERRGRVEFRGTEWNAEAFEELAAGAAVEIIDKKNITLVVKSI